MHSSRELHRRGRRVLRSLHRGDVRRGAGSRPPVLRDEIRSGADRTHGGDGALACLPPGHRDRLVRDRRGGSRRRPVLRIQADPADAVGGPAVDAVHRSRGRPAQRRARGFRGQGNRPHRAPGWARRSGVSHRRLGPAVARRRDQHVLPRRARAGVRAALRPAHGSHAAVQRRLRGVAAACGSAHRRRGARQARHTCGSPQVRRLSRHLRLRRGDRRAAGQRDRLPSPAGVRVEGVGLLGATAGPGAAHAGEPPPGGFRQGGRYHRSVERHRTCRGEPPCRVGCDADRRGAY